MASGGYSQISVAEPGQPCLPVRTGTPGRPTGEEPPRGDVAGQAKVAADNLAAALEELGASGKDIVMLRIYVVDATTEKFQQVQTPLDTS